MLRITSRAAALVEYMSDGSIPGLSPIKFDFPAVPTELAPSGDLVAVRIGVTFRAGLNEFELTMGTGAVTKTDGTAQVETLTVVVPTTTTEGTLPVTVTSRETGTYIVPVAIASGLTQNAVATAIRNALIATPINDYYAATTSTNTVILTSRTPEPNDATLELSNPAALGISAATSANTTAGVGGVTFDAKSIDADGLVTEGILSDISIAAMMFCRYDCSAAPAATLNVDASSIFQAGALLNGDQQLLTGGYDTDTVAGFTRSAANGITRLELMFAGLI